MLIQQVGDRQIVYVPNYKTDFMAVAQEFGMVDDFGNFQNYVRHTEETYVNPYGISMPSHHFVGKTVNMFIVDDHVEAKSNTASDIVNALNYFPGDSRFSVAGHTFTAKFKGDRDYIRDAANRSLTINGNMKKDLAKIHDIMTHLGLNNGKLFEPVITRYVYTSREMPPRMPLVGYFDLEMYLRVISDPSAVAFYQQNSNLLVYLELGTARVGVKLTNIVKDCCELEFANLKGAYDLKKMAEFKPVVVLTTKPLVIKDMKFPWTKVRFDKTDVFMTPLMSKMDAWETLQGGVDLLSVPEKASKKK